MIVTSSKRRTDDYHKLLSEVEDPLDYLTEKGHVPGQWIGQGAAPSGLEGEVSKEAFIHQTFGFRQRTMTPTERERGVDPAVEAWAKVKLDRWKARHTEERIVLRERQIARLEGKDDKKTRREVDRLRAEIEAVKEERKDILSHYGSLEVLRKAETEAKTEALKVIDPVLQGADPVGYTAAMLKFRHAELTGERDAAKASGKKKEAEILDRKIADLAERAKDFFAQSNEIREFRKQADQFREEAKSKSIDSARLLTEGTYLDAAAELRAESKAAEAVAEGLEHLLKDTPGAYAQGLTLTTSMHKSFALARHAMPKQQSDELLKVMERANRRLVESAGKKYGRARISKTVEREVVGPDGSVKMEKTTEVEYHKIRGLTAATFFHSDARGVKGDKGPPDPSDHFHNELMKDVTTLDGKTVALDQGYLLDNMKAIGAEGQAILAEEAVKAGFKVEFYVSKSGERTVGIAGFSDGLIEENSKRGASIKVEKAKGLDDQKAWASKRGGKEYDPATLEGVWRKKFAGLGFKKDGKVEQRLERQPAKLADKTYAYKSDAEIIRRLTEKEAHFSEGDIRREVYLAAAEAAAVGDFDALKKADARIERIAASPDLKPIDADFLSAITGRDATGEAHFYSKRMLTEEVATIRAFEKMAGERTHTLPEEQAKRIISEIERKKSKELGCDFKFRDDQVETILHATDGRRFALISAKAGTGKTTSLTASIEILEQQGRKVILASSWNKAASQISADTSKLRGKEVFTIVQLRGLVEKGEVKLDGKTTVMVDEAGLASHAEVTWLREAAEKSGCSVLLQGDESQTAAVSTGKPFRRMVESGLVEVKSLTVITRQRDDDQKRATLAASRGDFAEAVDVYRKAGMVQDKFATKDAMVEKIAADFIACSDPLNQKICVATKNADVQALNDAIRTKLVEEGKLGKTGLFVSAKGGRKVELAQGERICLTARLEKNETISNALLRHAKKAINRSMKLRLDTRAKKERVGEKSEFGTVTKITGDGFYLRMDGQKKDVFIKRTEVPDVAYGYAATTSKLQGSTVETAFHMHGSFSNAALAYVSLSRHKKACHIYASEDEARTMVADMGRKELKLDSLDLLPPEEADRIRANLGMPLEEAKVMLTEVKVKANDALARSSVDGALRAAEKTLAETDGRVKRVSEAVRKLEAKLAAKEPDIVEVLNGLIAKARTKHSEFGRAGSPATLQGAVGSRSHAEGGKKKMAGESVGLAERVGRLQALRQRALDGYGTKPNVLLQGDRRSDVGTRGEFEEARIGNDALRRDVEAGGDQSTSSTGAEPSLINDAWNHELVFGGTQTPANEPEAIRDATAEDKSEPAPHATASLEFLAKSEATASDEPLVATPTGEATNANIAPMATADGDRKKAEATAKAETHRGAKPTGNATADGRERIEKALNRVSLGLYKRAQETWRSQKADGVAGMVTENYGACAIRAADGKLAARGIVLDIESGKVLLVELSGTAQGGVDYEKAKLHIASVPCELLKGKEVGKTVTLAFDADGNASVLQPPAAVSKIYASKSVRDETDWGRLDVLKRDAFGMTAAHHAAAQGDEETLEKVLAVGGDPGQDRLGRTIASLGGRNELDENREPEKATETTASAPASAVRDEAARAEKRRELDEWKRLRVENELLKRNLELDREARRQAEVREATVLLLNTPEFDGVLIRGLLEKGASVKECIKASYGPTALLANAPDSLPTEDLIFLLDAGADTRGAEAVLDRRALKAAGDGDIYTLSKLAGAEVDIDETLRKMARSGDDKAVTTLLAAGANPDAKDKNGRSALDEAVDAEKRGSAGAAAARKTLEYASAPAAPAAVKAPATAARTPK